MRFIITYCKHEICLVCCGHGVTWRQTWMLCVDVQRMFKDAVPKDHRMQHAAAILKLKALTLRTYEEVFCYDVNLSVLALHHGRVETQLIFIKGQ